MAKTAKKKKTIRSIPQLRTPVRELEPKVRVKNFEEVNCGYLLNEAMNEAERCLLCPDPGCIKGCPVNINIPKFIEAISAKDLRGAYDVITASNLLASVCGRVCPQENAMRRRLHRRRDARTGRDRPAGTLCRRHRDQGEVEQRPLHRAERLQDRHRRFGTGRHGLRGRHGQSGMRRDRVRGFPSGRRRSQISASPISACPTRSSTRRSKICASSASSSSATRWSAACLPSSRCATNSASTPSSSAPAPAIPRCSASPAIRSTACCRPMSCSPAAT